jgi:hypothetical protein
VGEEEGVLLKVFWNGYINSVIFGEGFWRVLRAREVLRCGD